MPRVSSAAAAVVVVALFALAAGAASQMAPAAGPSADCGSALTSLVGCLTYITPGSTQSKPPGDCCAAVKTALGSPATVTCLCDAFGKDFGIPVNRTRGVGLPAACGGNPAAFSKCNLKLPGGAPTEAPSPPSGSTTPASSTPGPAKSAAATRSPVSATVVLAAMVAPLLSYYFL